MHIRNLAHLLIYDSPFNYIEMFYNAQRKYARNGMLSPAHFENNHKLKRKAVYKSRGYSKMCKVCRSVSSDPEWPHQIQADVIRAGSVEMEQPALVLNA